MIPTNTVFDYSQQENIAFKIQIQEFFEIFDEAAKLLEKIKLAEQNKVKPTKELAADKNESLQPTVKQVTGQENASASNAYDDAFDNVYFINRQIIVDFNKTLEHRLPFHDIISTYEEWFDELWRLQIVNEKKLGKHKALTEHFFEIFKICASFQAILEVVTKEPSKK